ncbi:MAG: hypothetical protein CMJ52_10385, partial [Planctomycetaceae bacterium]|nr:hypothetical protein [Planctomycetaceae bacterium]
MLSILDHLIQMLTGMWMVPHLSVMKEPQYLLLLPLQHSILSTVRDLTLVMLSSSWSMNLDLTREASSST